MTRFLLSTDSFLCMVDNHAVFLNLKRDTYSALEPDAARAVSYLVRGWPAASQDAVNEEFPSASAGAIADTLLKEGLLTDNPMYGKLATPVSLDAPEQTFWVDSCSWPYLEPHHLKNFIRAWLVATAMLRCVPLKWIVYRARIRKQNSLQSAVPFDVERTNRLAVNYFALQPAFFSAHNACLRNSLTLLEFLACYGIYPAWVFGVKVRPFGAHAWVQHGRVVFTDPLEQVRLYTPIMAV